MIMKAVYPTLFKRTSVGAIQIWRLEMNDSRTAYRSVSGQKDGAQVESGWVTAEIKNKGRANSTTAEQQCELEVKAKYALKLAQGGYHENEKDIDKPKFFKPMLAKGYKDHFDPDDIDDGVVFSQPKLDGVRCIMDSSGVWSRQGKPLLTAPHLYDRLAPLFERYPDLRLDGELYADKLSDDFQKILSLAKKQKPDAAELAEAAKYLQYHIYDVPSVEGPFSRRYDELLILFSVHKLGELGAFRLVPTELVKKQDRLDELQSEYLEDGMEGQMVRISRDPYKNSRSDQLLKRKEFIDGEFEITDVLPAKDAPHRAGKIEFKMEDDRRTQSGERPKAGLKFNHAYREWLLANKKQVIGSDATVRYFRLTNDGIPYLPVAHAIHDGKRST
jgi:DNA ligase-1